MASAILRTNTSLRSIYRSLSNYTFRGTPSHSPSPTPSGNNFYEFSHTGVPEIIRRSSPPGFRCDEYGPVALQALSYRFLCTGSAATTGGEANGNAGNSSGNSGGGEGSQKTGEQGKSIRGSPVSWMSFLLLLATGVSLISYYDREKKRHIEGLNTASKAVKQGPSAGKAAIGGPFNLVDHNGKPVTEKDFLGKWTLLYFGFTHCPDICPTELQKIAVAVDKIKEKSGIPVLPVFITVDPERDTVEQVHDYVKEFHRDLVGLTGTVDEIKKAARAYRIYYMKTAEEDSDYLVDHSIVIYLMDPQMELRKYFGANSDTDSLADGVIQEVMQYNELRA